MIGKYPARRRVLRPLYRGRVDLLWFLRARPVEFHTTIGSLLMHPEGHIARVVLEDNFEHEECSAIESLLKPGMKIVNVGANAGLYALLCGKIVGSEGEVHAFEPVSGNFQRLMRNISLNGLNNIYAEKCAVSDKPRNLAMYLDPSHPHLDGHYSSVAESRNAESFFETVPAVALDDYWYQHTGGLNQPVDMMIIDVEGSELDVLKGAVRLIKRHRSLRLW